jgi:Uma2 family endonuclease
MSTVTRPSSRPPAAMETTAVLDEERGVMRGVSWEFYDRLTDAIGERGDIRIAYDGKDMEIMTLGPKHERSKGLLGSFIEAVAEGLEVDFRAAGSTTWKRAAKRRGIESDLCYYFHRAKLEASDAAAAHDSNDVADYPNPDLAAEIDISPSKIDRLSIYAALKVSEIWRFKGDAVSIERLGPNGVYRAVAESRFLSVRPDEITRWLANGKSGSRLDWKRKLRDWIQAELRPRVVAKPSRRRLPHQKTGGNGA